MADQPIRVFIVDGDPEVRQQLVQALSRDERWDVLGDATQVAEVVESVTDLQPDVVVLDRLDGPSREALPRVLHLCPTCMVTVVSAEPVPEHEREFQRLGVFSAYEKRQVMAGLGDVLLEDYHRFQRALQGHDVVVRWRASGEQDTPE